MDGIEKQVMNEDIDTSSQNGTNVDPLDQMQSDAASEQMRQKMLASHTRRMQEVAREKRTYEQRNAELQALMMQMQGQQGTRQQEAVPQQASPYSDYFSPTLQKQIESEPLLKELVQGFEKKFSSNRGPSEDIAGMRGEIESLKNMLAQQQQRNVHDRLMKQVSEVGAKYKGKLDPETAERALQMAVNQDVDIERALRFVAPEVVDEHIRAEAFQAAEKQIRSQYGGSLNGMDEMIGTMPKESSTPLHKDGRMESMRESALQALGRGGYLDAINRGVDIT